MPKSENKEFKKATIAISEQRTNEIISALLEGKSRASIVQIFTEKWNLEERQIDVYIKKANDKIKELGQVERESEFNIALMRLNRLFELAYKIQDFKTCLAVQKEINALHGQYPTMRQEFIGKVEYQNTQLPDLSQLTFEQLYELKHGHKPNGA